MMHADKYKPGYFPAPRCEMRWAKKDHIEKPPIWCSVDLRDGNQALVEPMVVEEKIEMFNMLVQMGSGSPPPAKRSTNFCARSSNSTSSRTT